MPLRVLVLNDTRRGSFNRHLGCNVVMESLLHLCAAHGLEVVRTLTTAEPLAAVGFEESLRQVDAVIVNGEGTMHHDSRGALALSAAILHAKRAGRKTALLNAVWQDNRQVNACLGALDFVCARDLLSQGQMRAAGAAHARVAPDLSLYRAGGEPMVNPSLKTGVTASAPAALVIDSVDEAEARRLRQFSAAHGLPFRVMQAWAVREADERHPLAHERFFSLEDLTAPAVLITGRFHAICFAIKYGRPFLAVPSNTHKMEALLHDVGVPADEFLLPERWEQRSASYWIERGLAAWQRHGERLGDFARRAPGDIEQTLRDLVRTWSTEPSPLPSFTASDVRSIGRRKVRVCVFSPWIARLEEASSFAARPLRSDLTAPSMNRRSLLDADAGHRLVRQVLALQHEAIEFRPGWVCGPQGLVEFAKADVIAGEERWLLSAMEDVDALSVHAGKVFGLLVRVGVRHLVLAPETASQDTAAIRDIAPHIDVLLRNARIDDELLAAKLADAIATGG